MDGWDNAANLPIDESYSEDSKFNWHIYPSDKCDNNKNHDQSFDQSNNCHNNDIVYLGESCYSDKTKILGLYRYMEYVNENNLWIRIGDAYMAIGKDDNHQNFIYNLLPSVMIYNPNDIPIRIQYLIFS